MFICHGLTLADEAGSGKPNSTGDSQGDRSERAPSIALVIAADLIARRPGSLASILTAFAIWNATKAWLCDPHSLIQGHAI